VFNNTTTQSSNSVLSLIMYIKRKLCLITAQIKRHIFICYPVSYVSLCGYDTSWKEKNQFWLGDIKEHQFSVMLHLVLPLLYSMDSIICCDWSVTFLSKTYDSCATTQSSQGQYPLWFLMAFCEKICSVNFFPFKKPDVCQISVCTIIYLKLFFVNVVGLIDSESVILCFHKTGNR
jgi:hypothetical protein